VLASSQVQFPFWIVFILATFFCLVVFGLRHAKSSALFLAAVFFCLGILRGELASSKSPHTITHFISKSSAVVRLIGIVETEPISLEGEKSSFDLRALSLKRGARWKDISGRLRVFASDHPPPPYGEEIMVEGSFYNLKSAGNPGEFDLASFLKRRGIDGTLHVKPYHGLLCLGRNHASFFLRALVPLRQKALGSVYQMLPKKEAALFGAMILGDRSRLEGELWDLFTRTGTVHLLSISGLHVGIFATLIYLLFKILRLRKHLAFFFTLFFLSVYATLVGGSPPVVRSTVMIMLYLLGSLLGREVFLLNILSFAYLLLLLFNPFYLYEVGFQLSFLSVFFLFLTDEKFKAFFKQKRPLSFLSRAARYFCELFIISIGVWVGIWPVVAYHFYSVSPVSWIANCFVIPLLFPIVGMGVLWFIVNPLFPVLPAIFLRIEGMLLSLLVSLTECFDRIPFGSFHFAASAPFLIVYYLMLGIFLLKSFRRLRWKTCMLTLIFFNVSVWGPLFEKAPSKVKATFLDVGHGDAIFLEFPRGGNLLIDGGDRREGFDAGRKVIAPFFWKRNIYRLDAVLLTHADQDHVGGVPTVLEAFHPHYVFESGFPKDTVAYRRYRKTLKKLRIKPILLHRGQKITGYPGVSLEILNPPTPFLRGTGRDENNNGVVLKLTHGDVHLLFTADIQERALEDLRRSGQDLRAEILKMPHHGGDLGEEAASFLRAVSPNIAVISVGEKEGFHLPSLKTISLLDHFRIPIYQTVDTGAIHVVSDGENIFIETGREGR